MRRLDASERATAEIEGAGSSHESSEKYEVKGRRTKFTGGFLQRAGFVCLLFAGVSFCLHFYVVGSRDDVAKVFHLRDRSGRAGGGDGNQQCSIYMAPSSIKGHSGFGIYTTRDIPKDTDILAAPDGPSIPVLDYHLGPKTKSLRQWLNLFGDYWWGRGVPDHVTYEAGRVFDYQITFGSLPNHHCILDSVDLKYPDPAYDDTLLNRFRDPGAGAVSYSMGRTFIAQRDIRANEELFLNYGHCQHESNDDWTAHIPMPDDYNEAARIIREFWKTKPENRNDELLELPPHTNERVASLVPSFMNQIEKLMSFVNGNGIDDLVEQLARHVVATPRSSDWIRSHGLCLEHLVPAKSQIPQAGQGAIAQHPIRKGDIVVPAPMLHILDRDSLIIYDENKNRTGEQLMTNYCLGHPESSFLMCPNTNAILVNHCSVRTKECGPKGPNAEYRWSSGWDPRSDAWRRMSLKEIAKQSGRGLSMEIVALRDIRKGEEVFVDYGIEWEIAWGEHLKKWSAPPAVEGWMTAKEANDDTTLESFLTGNIRSVMDHPHLFAGCRYWKTKADRHQVYQTTNTGWYNLTDDEILQRYADDGSLFGYGDYAKHGDQSHWPCSVLRQDGDGEYIVRIHQSDWDIPQKWARNDLPRLLTKYPRSAIHFFVKPYESDQHLPTGFRHPIGIPSDIFPDKWKNSKA